MAVKVSINVVGPGLVVNWPTELLEIILAGAGAKVIVNKYDGQLEEGPLKRLDGYEIEINVDPQPWGG